MAYYDVVNVLTVCDGHTGKDIIPSKKYSDAECDALLQQDLAPVQRIVDAAVRIPLRQYAHHDIIAEMIKTKSRAMAWALSVLFIFFKLERHFKSIFNIGRSAFLHPHTNLDICCFILRGFTPFYW